MLRLEVKVRRRKCYKASWIWCMGADRNTDQTTSFATFPAAFELRATTEALATAPSSEILCSSTSNINNAL